MRSHTRLLTRRVHAEQRRIIYPLLNQAAADLHNTPLVFAVLRATKHSPGQQHMVRRERGFTMAAQTLRRGTATCESMEAGWAGAYMLR